MKKLLYAITAVLAFAGCSKYYVDGDYLFPGEAGYASDSEAGGVEGPGENGGNGQGGEAGVITAGEWNDLDNWNFWGGLMTGEQYKEFSFYWGLNTSHRFAVKVVDAASAPVAGASVELKSADGTLLWTSRTDNSGSASLWAGVFEKESQVSLGSCTVSINGVQQDGNPAVSDWAGETVTENLYTLASAPKPGNNVDIAFIVDAPGSMGDEIDFLKEDLMDILNTVGQKQTSRSIYTGTVFYRDKGDDYVTRTSAFTTDISKTVNFVKKQSASGGGDWPEAVHTALEVAVNELQWHGDAYSKLAFMVLDAPAHHDQQGVIESMQASIEKYSRMGIKIIPVFCSSFSKDCEFMCRQFAILTGGTYVFLTDDSQVGGEHVEASVGQYQVEHLNDLIVRLIDKYIS